MTLRTKKLTYQEYLEMTPVMGRCDIIDGELIMSSSPNRQYQTVLRQLFLGVNQFVTEHDLGEVWFAPLDVVVREEPLRVRQPDLLFVSNENRDILGHVIHGGPDLVVEILSPSNSRGDIESKLADYAGLGVLECWLVSPQAQTVEVLVLEQGEWRRLAILGIGDDVKSTVLTGLELQVARIFGDT
jgi:Uma2 family endonuclease